MQSFLSGVVHHVVVMDEHSCSLFKQGQVRELLACKFQFVYKLAYFLLFVVARLFVLVFLSPQVFQQNRIFPDFLLVVLMLPDVVEDAALGVASLARKCLLLLDQGALVRL